MIRKDFLKKLVAGSIGLLAIRVPQQPVKSELLSFYIRGFQYYHGPELLEHMKAGDKLTLVREQKNPHDPQAIAVHYSNRKIGFVPREHNEVISKLIDHAVLPLYCEIIEVQPDAEPWEAVLAKCYAVTHKA